jgi:hypothetical protein
VYPLAAVKSDSKYHLKLSIYYEGIQMIFNIYETGCVAKHMKSTHRQPRFLRGMCIVSKQFKLVQNTFPSGDQENLPLIFSF